MNSTSRQTYQNDDRGLRPYLRSEKRSRRRRAMGAAAMFLFGATVAMFLASRMTDRSHFVGFATLAALLLVGASLMATRR